MIDILRIMKEADMESLSIEPESTSEPTIFKQMNRFITKLMYNKSTVGV